MGLDINFKKFRCRCEICGKEYWVTNIHNDTCYCPKHTNALNKLKDKIRTLNREEQITGGLITKDDLI